LVEAPWTDAGLTPREYEVLTELVLGKSNREIADTLFISERTVKKHLTNLFRKTGASSRIAVALWGQERMPAAPSALNRPPPLRSYGNPPARTR
jgi:DNA-binding NarL/FixJ family response regulator